MRALYDHATNHETAAMIEELAEAIQDIELEALELEMIDDLDEHGDL